MTIAIRFAAASKRYRVHHQSQFLGRQVLRLLMQRPSRVEEHWALRDVSFAVEAGEGLGVIGRNGAGKSTLLGLIARTTRPTSGSVEVSGRVAPMLELGAGFHPDLTGYENIFLNAMLLGLSRQEVTDRLDSIVEYADIGTFLDTPIRTYSTGMRARLGFAVVAHVDPDVILLDEVLGVGDGAFQAKCRDTIEGFRSRGKTLFLVSHQLQNVRRLCDRVVWIEAGRVRRIGPAADVVDEYRSTFPQDPADKGQGKPAP